VRYYPVQSLRSALSDVWFEQCNRSVPRGIA
jgi:hypothetical protein